MTKEIIVYYKSSTLHLFTFQTPIFHKVMKYKNIIIYFYI